MTSHFLSNTHRTEPGSALTLEDLTQAELLGLEPRGETLKTLGLVQRHWGRGMYAAPAQARVRPLGHWVAWQDYWHRLSPRT
jgi:hypothetical protein